MKATRRRPVLGAVLLAALWLGLPPAPARAADAPVRIGMAVDLSGPYAALGGTGSVLGATMAIEDFGGSVLGRKIELLSFDTQNKPDVAAGLAREWFDTKGVAVILDGSASSVGLALQTLAFQHNKLFLDTGGFSSAFIGQACTPTTLQFVPNTQALSVAGLTQALSQGIDTWFFITADYAFGNALQRDATAIIQAHGGRVLGAAKHPLATADMSSFILQAQASGAKGLALANAGNDLVNTIKQLHEFGVDTARMKPVALLTVISDLEAIGPQYAQGLTFSTTVIPAMDPKVLDWSRRFTARHGGHAPTVVHMMAYSGAMAYLKAVRDLGTDDNAKVAARLHEVPIDDVFVHNAPVRPDGRVMNDVMIVRVKQASAITDPLDNLDVVSTIKAEQLYPSAAESACKLFHTATQ
jgi:branched-chain amino acid transport system substrate-binding protein